MISKNQQIWLNQNYIKFPKKLSLIRRELKKMNLNQQQRFFQYAKQINFASAFYKFKQHLDISVKKCKYVLNSKYSIIQFSQQFNYDIMTLDKEAQKILKTQIQIFKLHMNIKQKFNQLDKFDNIFTYIRDLFIFIIKIGIRFFQQYQLQFQWLRNQNKSWLKKYVLEIYKKYFKFYCHQLYLNIQSNIQDTLQQYDFSIFLKNNYNQNVLTQQIQQNLQKTINIMNINAKKSMFTYNREFKKILHKQDQFCLKVKPKIKRMYNQRLVMKVRDFNYLRQQEKKYLWKNLNDVLEGRECILSDEQKWRIRQVIERMNLRKEKNISQQWRYIRQEQNLMSMVDLFIMFEDYNGYIRHYLKLVFRGLINFSYGYSNFKVLVTLQNEECGRWRESKQLKLLRKQCDVQKANKKITDKIKKLKFEDPDYSQIKQPQLFQFNFIKKSKSKLITIFISGFTCQYDDKKQYWKQITSSFVGQAYALNWRSYGKSDLLLKFEQASVQAEITGAYLAGIIEDIFKYNIINLVGFSLGSEVVVKCLQFLLKRKNIDMIYEVIFLGGVAEKKRIENIINIHPIQVINFYNPNDYVLSFAQTLYKRQLCCGKNLLNAFHWIQNINTQDIRLDIKGHSVTFQKLKKRIQLDNDTYYYSRQLK